MNEKKQAIREYLKSNDFNDDLLDTYDENIIDTITQIIKGDLPEYEGELSEDSFDDRGIILHYCGLFYNINNKYDLAETYYLLSCRKDNYNAFDELAVIYYRQRKYDLSEKYFLLSVDKGYSDSLTWLALVYIDQLKYDSAIKTLLLAIEKGVHTTRRVYGKLAYVYHVTKQYDLAKKYYLLTFEQKDYYCIDSYLLLIKSTITQYLFLKSLNTNDEKIVKQIKLIENDKSKFKQITGYIIKKERFSVDDMCTVCMEDSKCIPSECGHVQCDECYQTLYPKCSICDELAKN